MGKTALFARKQSGGIITVNDETAGTGNIFFVNSVTGTDSAGYGASPDAPFKTLAFAIGQATANNNDRIFVMQGHAETVVAAAGINLNVAGLRIVGMGLGNQKPTINFTTSTAAAMALAAANVSIENLRFTCGIASQVTMLTVTAKQVRVLGCDFAEGAQTGLSFIAVTGNANDADRLTVQGCSFYNPTAGNMNHAIGLSEVNDAVRVDSNLIVGQFALSGLHNITGKVLTNLSVTGNVIRNLTAGKQAMQLISACTGQAVGNRFIAGDTTVHAASFGTALLGEDNRGNNGCLDAGEYFVFAKTGLVSSAILQTGVVISGAASGRLMAEAVTVQTGATGLATGTNFQLTVNNVAGLPAPWVEAVANLGANKTVTAGSVASTQFVVENGKVLTAKSTAADCTGAGTIDVYIRFRRIDHGANIVPV